MQYNISAFDKVYCYIIRRIVGTKRIPKCVLKLYITIKLPHIHGKTATVQRQNCHTKNGTATMSIFCI